MSATDIIDPLEKLIETEWLKSVKGTWSQADFKIFAAAFRRGYQERGNRIRNRMAQLAQRERDAVGAWETLRAELYAAGGGNGNS
jgi:hypothetical protein